VRYAFIRAESAQWPVRALCNLFDVHPSGYYAWLNKPRSKRAIANERLTGLIKQFWLESGGVYGYRKIFSDLREYGEHCGKNRVYRLMQAAGLRAQIGYRRPRHRSGPAHVVVPNLLQRQFSTKTPDQAWSLISRISAPTKVGFTWQWCLICSRGVSLAGRCNHE